MSDTPIDTCDTSVIGMGVGSGTGRSLPHADPGPPRPGEGGCLGMGSVEGVTGASTRSPWRAVVIPSEHGGWGLTLEPALLGLLVAPSIAGGALAIAAFLA